MKRREFITLLGGAVVAWPMEAGAQQPAIPVVGFLRSNSLDDVTHLVTAFRQGLKEVGFSEGQNVAIEFRSAEGHHDRLPALVLDLVRRPVAAIVANNISAIAAKAETSTIPIIFTTGSDPVRDGLVASLNRPGGNVTGVVFITGVLGAKRLDLFRQLVPNARMIAMFVSPNIPEGEAERRDVEAAARATGQQLLILNVESDQDIETAFATLIQRGADALIVGTGPFFFSNRRRVVGLAARHAIPAVYSSSDAVAAGGLMSYGSRNADAFRLAGIYAGRILKGEKPSELPVMQSTKFELMLNLKTARALGLAVPDRLLALADEVIE